MHRERHREACQRGGIQRKGREEPSLRGVRQAGYQTTKEGWVTQEVGGKLGNTKRIINWVTHSSQGEQVEVALVMRWSLMVDSSRVRLKASVERWEQKPYCASSRENGRSNGKGEGRPLLGRVC